MMLFGRLSTILFQSIGSFESFLTHTGDGGEKLEIEAWRFYYVL